MVVLRSVSGTTENRTLFLFISSTDRHTPLTAMLLPSFISVKDAGRSMTSRPLPDSMIFAVASMIPVNILDHFPLSTFHFPLFPYISPSSLPPNPRQHFKILLSLRLAPHACAGRFCCVYSPDFTLWITLLLKARRCITSRISM